MAAFQNRCHGIVILCNRLGIYCRIETDGRPCGKSPRALRSPQSSNRSSKSSNAENTNDNLKIASHGSNTERGCRDLRRRRGRWRGYRLGQVGRIKLSTVCWLAGSGGAQECAHGGAQDVERGLDLDMWGTVVNRDGVVCAVTFTGADRGSQWPGSRVISAQKANTANAFSLPGLALSTANLYYAVQPGGSLYGLQQD